MENTPKEQLKDLINQLLEYEPISQGYKAMLASNKSLNPKKYIVDKALLINAILERHRETDVDAMQTDYKRQLDAGLKELFTEYQDGAGQSTLKPGLDIAAEIPKVQEEAQAAAFVGIFAKALEELRSGALVLKSLTAEEYNKQPLHLFLPNHKLYQGFRDKLSKGAFDTKGEGWPWADIKGHDINARVAIKPDTSEEPRGEKELARLKDIMRQKVMDLAKYGDLAADVFDIITAKWLKEANHHESAVTVTADDILEARGLARQKGGSGRRGGYKEEWRRDIQQQIDTLSTTWLTVEEMRVPKKGKKAMEKVRVESKAVVLSSREGQIRIDGTTDAYAWRIRPGDVFSTFLFGEFGRQTALLSLTALRYDYYRQRWEKRLARYLSWLWRIDTVKTIEGISVSVLMEAVGEEIYAPKPGRTRQRLEKALDTLQKDGVIVGWQYELTQEERPDRREWAKYWLQCKVIIEPPELITDQYKKLSASSKAD